MALHHRHQGLYGVLGLASRKLYPVLAIVPSNITLNSRLKGELALVEECLDVVIPQLALPPAAIP